MSSRPPTYDEAIVIAMRAGDIDQIRKMERERLAIMREASRKEVFTQGYIAGRFPEGGDDEETLAALSDASAAYKRIMGRRGPA